MIFLKEFKIWISGAVEYSSSSNVFLITRVVLHHYTKFIFIFNKARHYNSAQRNFFLQFSLNSIQGADNKLGQFLRQDI